MKSLEIFLRRSFFSWISDVRTLIGATCSAERTHPGLRAFFAPQERARNSLKHTLREPEQVFLSLQTP